MKNMFDEDASKLRLRLLGLLAKSVTFAIGAVVVTAGSLIVVGALVKAPYHAKGSATLVALHEATFVADEPGRVLAQDRANGIMWYRPKSSRQVKHIDLEEGGNIRIVESLGSGAMFAVRDTIARGFGLEELRLVAVVSQKKATHVVVGSPVRITGRKDEEFRGTVERVSGAVQAGHVRIVIAIEKTLAACVSVHPHYALGSSMEIDIQCHEAPLLTSVLE